MIINTYKIKIKPYSLRFKSVLGILAQAHIFKSAHYNNYKERIKHCVTMYKKCVSIHNLKLHKKECKYIGVYLLTNTEN